MNGSKHHFFPVSLVPLMGKLCFVQMGYLNQAWPLPWMKNLVLRVIQALKFPPKDCGMSHRNFFQVEFEEEHAKMCSLYLCALAYISQFDVL